MLEKIWDISRVKIVFSNECYIEVPIFQFKKVILSGPKISRVILKFYCNSDSFLLREALFVDKKEADYEKYILNVVYNRKKYTNIW